MIASHPGTTSIGDALYNGDILFPRDSFDDTERTALDDAKFFICLGKEYGLSVVDLSYNTEYYVSPDQLGGYDPHLTDYADVALSGSSGVTFGPVSQDVYYDVENPDDFWALHLPSATDGYSGLSGIEELLVLVLVPF